LVKDADAVVMSWDRPDAKHGTCSFGVYVDGVLTPVGSCSLIGKPAVEVGDVIAVAYLYRDAKGGLIQPRLVSVRRPEEKRPEDCTMEQFPLYSRKALAI
jgi:hypothetical protein